MMFVWYDNQLLLVIGFIEFIGVQSVYQVWKAFISEKPNPRLSSRRRDRNKSVADTETNFSHGHQLLLKNVLRNRLCDLFEDFLVAE